MSYNTYRIEQDDLEQLRKKRADNIALIQAHNENEMLLDEQEKAKANPKIKSEGQIKQVSSKVFNKDTPNLVIADAISASLGLPTSAQEVNFLGAKKILGKPDAKEIASVTPQVLEKTTNPSIILPSTSQEKIESKPLITSTENIDQEAPIDNANPETVQRKVLWDIWQEAVDELNGLLQDLHADPSDSVAANRIMLLCSHLASQMNHETARSLLDFIEDTRVENLKKAYKPNVLDVTPLIFQILGALAGGICGIIPAAQGLVGSASKPYDVGSQICNGLIVNVASSFGQLYHGVKSGKQAVVSHELETDKRLQQDLQHRRQQAEQAAKRELDNIKSMWQQKHETVRSINN